MVYQIEYLPTKLNVDVLANLVVFHQAEIDVGGGVSGCVGIADLVGRVQAVIEEGNAGYTYFQNHLGIKNVDCPA